MVMVMVMVIVQGWGRFDLSRWPLSLWPISLDANLAPREDPNKRGKPQSHGPELGVALMGRPVRNVPTM